MLKEDTIIVPEYQRAYYWECPVSSLKYSQVAVFLEDIIEQINSSTNLSCYLGHFIFEKGDVEYRVVDGHQRLITASILLSAVFMNIDSMRTLSEREKMLYEDTLRRGSYVYRFSTVDCDNQFFRDYVIDRTRRGRGNLLSPSASRIADCSDYYESVLGKLDESLLSRLLQALLKATCTTHSITDTSEAIRLFTFHNNRGR